MISHTLSQAPETRFHCSGPPGNTAWPSSRRRCCRSEHPSLRTVNIERKHDNRPQGDGTRFISISHCSLVTPLPCEKSTSVECLHVCKVRSDASIVNKVGSRKTADCMHICSRRQSDGSQHVLRLRFVSRATWLGHGMCEQDWCSNITVGVDITVQTREIKRHRVHCYT